MANTEQTTAERVGANVRRLRLGQGMTLAELSARLREIGYPIGVSSLSKIENGDRGIVAEVLESLAAALSVTTNQLFGSVDRDAAVRVEGLFGQLDIIAVELGQAEGEAARLLREARLAVARAERSRESFRSVAELIATEVSEQPDLIDTLDEKRRAGIWQLIASVQPTKPGPTDEQLEQMRPAQMPKPRKAATK